MSEERGTKLLQDFQVLCGPLVDGPLVAKLAHVQRMRMKQGFGHRARSISSLADGDPKSEAQFRRTLHQSAPQIEIAAQRALRENTGAPDEAMARIGLFQIDRQTRRGVQGQTTSNWVWPAHALPPRLRGSSHLRAGADVLVVSKLITPDGVFAGPSRQLPAPHCGPAAESIAEVLDGLGTTHPTTPIIDLRIDALLPREQVPSLLSGWLTGQDGADRQCVIPVDGRANTRRDDGSLCLARGGEDPYPVARWFTCTEDQFEDAHGQVVQGALSFTTMTTKELRLVTPDGRRRLAVRFVRVQQDDAPLDLPSGYLVTGASSAGHAEQLVTASMEHEDSSAAVAAFLQARVAGRVYKGEQRRPELLHTDRAIASLALNAALLDGWVPQATLARK